MGANFRSVNQIVRLAGADLLTISPELLDELAQTEGAVERQIDPDSAEASSGDQLHLDEKTFRWMHNEDATAKEKPAEGIRKFNSGVRSTGVRAGAGCGECRAVAKPLTPLSPTPIVWNSRAFGVGKGRSGSVAAGL